MRATIRVSELARELKVEPKKLLVYLSSKFGFRVRTVSSSIPAAHAEKIRKAIQLQRRRQQRPKSRQARARQRILQAAKQKKLREAAAEKARKEEEERKKEEAERLAREKAEEEARLEAEREEREAEARAEEEAAKEAAAKAAARAAARPRQAPPAPPPPKPVPAPPSPVEPPERMVAAAPAPESTSSGDAGSTQPFRRPAALPERPGTGDATGGLTLAKRPGVRRLVTRDITAPVRTGGFRPGATDRKIVPTVVRPVRRATPPRVRATPPRFRRPPALSQKMRRPPPGGRRGRRRRPATGEVPELTDGFDSPLPPGLRQIVGRTFTTTAEVEVAESITVSALADAMSIPASEVIKALLLDRGVAASINQPLDSDTAASLVRRFGGTVIEAPKAEDGATPVLRPERPEEEQARDEGLVERAPVVTVMGHVDHGKTSILDAVRHSRVVDGEAGGITQHMSAYAVEVNDHPIVFLDTPGHEAFTKMRARGAGVTDVVILVVAADDGVKEQTVEALNHAQAARVPIVVAVNKMDLPAADPDRVMRQLSERGVTPEEWGGDTIFCPVSARTKDGLPELLESVLDVAELEEPLANPLGKADGVVLEARKDRGRGPVAQVLVQNGTLKVGDPFRAGGAWGKVRALLSESGKRMKKAPPSMPVEVLGFADVPIVGDRFEVAKSLPAARRDAEERRAAERLAVMEGRRRLNLQNLHAQLSGGLKEFSVIVKADVGGTVEAVRDSLVRLSNDEVTVHVVHAAAGAVSESDVDLADTTNSIIVAFGVRPEPSAARLAREHNVEIRLHRVIYHLVEEVEKALAGLLEPEIEVVELGRIEVRQTFSVPRVGVVAGSYVLNGTIDRGAKVRLVRDGRVVHEGRIGSLRRFKEDVARVREGFECGLGIAGYNDVKIGDIIEAFREQEVRPSAE